MMSLMTLASPAKRGNYTSGSKGPYKSYLPDLPTGRGGYTPTPKGSIAGALSQPAEYLAQDAYRYYLGDFWRYHAEGEVRKQYQRGTQRLSKAYIRWAMYNFGYVPKKKNATPKNASPYSFKKGTKKRKYFVRRYGRKQRVRSVPGCRCKCSCNATRYTNRSQSLFYRRKREFY